MGKSTEMVICKKYVIDIPLNKALVAVEWKDDGGIYTSVKRCTGCFFYKNKIRECFVIVTDGFSCGKAFACSADVRKDGKNVIFKPVDLPEGVK